MRPPGTSSLAEAPSSGLVRLCHGSVLVLATLRNQRKPTGTGTMASIRAFNQSVFRVVLAFVDSRFVVGQLLICAALAFATFYFPQKNNWNLQPWMEWARIAFVAWLVWHLFGLFAEAVSVYSPRQQELPQDNKHGRGRMAGDDDLSRGGLM